MSLLALLAAQGIVTPTPEPEPETPPVDPATLTTLRHVTNHCAWWRTTLPAGEAGSWRLSEHQVRAPAKDLRIQQGVHGWAGADNGLTGRAALIVRGKMHWLTWEGVEQVTIARLTARVSDPLEGVQVSEGETIHVVWETPPNERIIGGNHVMGYPVTAKGSGTFPGDTTVNSAALSGAPCAIFGLTTPTDRPRSVALIGDSFVESGGWGHNALEASGLAWTDLSQWAEGTPSGLPPARFPQVDPFPFDAIVTAYGGNNSSNDLASQHEAHIRHWYALAGTGAKVAAMTLHPYSTSTDGWKSIDGQTPTEGHRTETRLARNEWLRDGAPLIDGAAADAGTTDPAAVRVGEDGHPISLGIFDQAAHTQHPDSPALWRVDGGAWTTDGAHLTAHGANSLAPHFAAWVSDHIPATV